MATTSTLTAIDELLHKAVEDGHLTAVAAAAADRGGVIYRGAAGLRSVDGAPMATDSVIWLGSMTKMIVAIGALQLVEQGRLSLDDPIGTVLPQLSDPQVLSGFDDDGEPVLRSASTSVTLRTLLNHTAGNGYHFWDANVLRYQQVKGLPGIIECREATLTTPLMFDPGTRWEYGMNIDWVGKAVEAVSGTDLESYLRARVLDPLGLADTTFVLADRHRERMAGMNFRADGQLVPLEFEMTQTPEFFMAGGAMYGSVEDYLVILRMILGGGEVNGVRILQQATVEEALRNQIGDLSIDPITSVEATSSNDVDFLPGTPKKWGLFGLLNLEASPQGRSPNSLFWAGLGNTYFWVDRGNGDCGVLATQILPFADGPVLSLLDAFESAVHNR